MRLIAKFTERNESFKVKFGAVTRVSDGGYEKGYADGAALLKERCEQTLSKYKDDSVKTVGAYTFYGCTEMKEVDLPNCTSVGSYAFYNNNLLTYVNLPKVERIGSYAFRSCEALKNASFPEVTTLGDTYSYAFSRCSSLDTIDFHKLEILGSYAFQLCSALTTLIIRTPTLCKLHGVSAINSRPINSKKGYIYVPTDLVDSYVGDANWSTFATQFRAIEDYPDILQS